ncbi:MAG: hypothetical protein V4612_00355 [Pseudomonadota bacterium]
MSKNELHYIFDDAEDLVFLLYVLFYNDLEKEFGDNDIAVGNYDAILKAIESDPKKLQFLKTLEKSLNSGILKPKNSKKIHSLNNVSINVLLFAAWTSKQTITSSRIFDNSIEILIDSQEKKKRISSFKKKLLPKEQFETLSKKEPLWNICQAILYVSGYRGFDNCDQDHECIKSDKELNKILNYAIDSKKIHELSFTDRDLCSPDHKLYVKPREFIEWAKKRFIESPFIYKEGVNIEGANSTKKATSYITPDMQLMFDAVEKFWSDYNLEKPNHHIAPVKSSVVDWLLEEAKKRKIDFSKTRAEHMDTIIRCPKSRKGGSTF